VNQANAIFNPCYFVDINGVGPWGGGRSLIVDPDGRVLPQAGKREMSLTEIIDLDNVQGVCNFTHGYILAGTRCLARLKQPSHRVDRRIERRTHGGIVPDVARRGPLHAWVDQGGALLYCAIDAKTRGERTQRTVPESILGLVGDPDATTHFVDRVAGAHERLDLVLPTF